MHETRFNRPSQSQGSGSPASTVETLFHLGPRDQRGLSIANYFTTDLTPKTLSTSKGGIAFIADIHRNWDFVREVVAPLGVVGTPTQHVRPIILGDLVTLPDKPLPTRTYFIAGNNDYPETFGPHRREELKLLNLVQLPLHTEFLGLRLLSLSGIPSPDMETLWDEVGTRRFGNNRMIDADQIAQLRELAQQGSKFDLLLSHMPPFFEKPKAAWPGSLLIANIAETFQCRQVYSGHLHMETLTRTADESGKERLAVGVNAGPLSVAYFDRGSWDVTKVFGQVAAADCCGTLGSADRPTKLLWRMPEFIDAEKQSSKFSTVLLQHCAMELLECITDALSEMTRGGTMMDIRDTRAFKLFQENAEVAHGAQWRSMFREALQQLRLSSALEQCVQQFLDANQQVDRKHLDPFRIVGGIVDVISVPSMD